MRATVSAVLRCRCSVASLGSLDIHHLSAEFGVCQPNDFIVSFTNSIVAVDADVRAVLSDRQIISSHVLHGQVGFVEKSEDTASSDLNTVFDYDSVGPRYIALWT